MMRPPGKVLPRLFYYRNTRVVARELLGKRLVHTMGDRRVSGIIVETEAYLGPKDRAAHTFGGRRTKRVEVMWGEGGHAYVYFIYGMHYCLNAVTRRAGQAEAVLIRALEPDEGLDVMMRARGDVQRGESRLLPLSQEVRLTNGPGKLCEALGITIDLNGADLTERGIEHEDEAGVGARTRAGSLFIEDIGLKVSSRRIVVGSRIGVDYAQEALHWPLRFCVSGNPFVSKPWPHGFMSKSTAAELFRNL